MIRLRTWMERGLGHRWIGLLVLALLVLLLFFLTFHSLSDALAHSTALVCMAIALLTAGIALLAFEPRPRRERSSPQRAPPPRPAPTTPLLALAFAQRSAPLRR